ncbi:MAG: hypothetical protein H6Q79_757 [Deltaproteobacteria bacterium]|nr:hypothetical protein [Deltaproteobacteria bacterium]
MRRGASFAALIAALLLASGCGPKAITVGSRPFPAGIPVFAAAPFPPGTVRVYRVLFDRETSLSPAGRQEVPPLRPAPLPEGDGPGDPGALKVTTLTALPKEFRKEFRVSQAPVLFLLDPGGKVARRWIGASVGMSLELASEIRKRSPALSPRPPGT